MQRVNGVSQIANMEKCSEGEEYVSNLYREESQALPAGRDFIEVLMEGSSGTASVNLSSG